MGKRESEESGKQAVGNTFLVKVSLKVRGIINVGNSFLLSTILIIILLQIRVFVQVSKSD